MATIQNTNVDASLNVNNAPITTIEPMGEPHDASATTGFTVDAGTVSATVNNPRNYTKLFRESDGNYRQEIKDFLAKPTVLASGTISSTDTATTFSSYSLPNGAVNPTSVYADKMSGYLGYRCTMVIRLQINANRFQQGRYMLTYVPTGGESIIVPSVAATVSAQKNTLRQRSQLMRIELDINCDTEGVLRIPFNSARNFVIILALAPTCLAC